MTATFEFPATHSQRAIWYVEQTAKNCRAYDLVYGIQIFGSIDSDALGKALQFVVNRHESLRSFFRDSPQGLVQVVPEVADAAFAESHHACHSAALSQIETDIAQGFNLTTGPLFKTKLYRIEEPATEDGPTSFVTFAYHHIVVDQSAVAVLNRELEIAYAAFTSGQSPQLPEGELDYSDFAVWQAEEKTHSKLDSKIDLWRELIDEPIGCINLPTDFPRPQMQSFTGQEIHHSIAPDLMTNIRQFSKDNSTSVFVTLMTAFGIHLSNFSGQERIIFGVPFANRNEDEDLEEVVGLFINSLPLPLQLQPNQCFTQLIATSGTLATRVQARQDVPLEFIAEQIPLERDAAYSPVYQVGFSVQPPSPIFSPLGMRTEDMQLHAQGSPFDLQVWVMDDGESAARFQVWYDDALFLPATVESLLQSFTTLVKQLLDNANRPLRELDFLGSDAAKLENWQGMSIAPPVQKNVADFVLNSGVEPTGTAVAAGTQSYSHGELDQLARQFAQYLHTHELTEGRRIGIAMDRNAELVPVLLGSMLAGCCYVPLDPEYPVDLLEYIIDHADIGALVVNRAVADRLVVGSKLPLIIIEDIWPELTNQPATFVSDPNPAADLAAYIIYTSGSTGRPKGVVVGHQSIINLLQSIHQTPGISADDRLLAVITLSFDMSVVELYAPIAAGGTTVIAAREDTVDPYRLGELIDQHAITIMQATPSTWRLLMESGYHPQQPLNAWTGGEPLARDLADMLLARTNELWNLYGPTEVTVYATGTRVLDSDHISIGKPVANSQCFVANEHSQLVPLGAPGELLVGGELLALGYLNQPELTDEKFIDNPFRPGTRLYRTGDLVRWLQDGNIEHLGRIDSQVKIRGFRIELEQIEATLNGLPEVSETVVEVVEFDAGDQRLVAYVAPQPLQNIEESTLREHAQAQLPEYMVPHFFTLLERIPRLPNGKVNRKALPTPQTPTVIFDESLSATEQVIHDQWQTIIGTHPATNGDLSPTAGDQQSIGVTQSFFGAGGHSLLLTKAVRTLFEHFDITLPFPELFQKPTIRQWAELTDRATRLNETNYAAEVIPAATRQANPEGAVHLPATFSQQALWFIQQANPKSAAYSIPLGYHLNEPINVIHFREAVDSVVKNNETLRTSFTADAEKIYQCIHPYPADNYFTLSEPTSNIAATVQIADWVDHPFDLASHDLFRCLVIPQEWSDSSQEIATGARIVVRFHHIISDLLSIHSVIDQIEAAYQALINGQRPAEKTLAIDYGDFAAWQQEHKTQEAVENRLEIWTSQINDTVGCINLPTDFDRPKRQSFQGNAFRTAVGAELTERIDTFARAHELSAFNIFFSGYILALHQYSRQNNIIVGVPFANRSDDSRLDEMVGMFINTLPVPCNVRVDASFLEHTKSFQETALALQANQDIPLNYILDALPVTRDASYNPLFQVGFSLQDAPRKLTLGTKGVAPFDVESNTSMFDQHLWLVDEGDGQYDIILNYDTALYTRESMDAFIDSYLNILSASLDSPKIALSQLRFHDIGKAYSQGPTLDLPAIDNLADYLFANGRDADKHAVISGENRLTHAELQQEAAQFAAYLRNQGLKPGSKIGFAINREIEVLPMLCGALWAGVCYVPLDPAYPADLLNYVIDDAGLDALIMHREVANSSSLNTKTPKLIVEEIWPQLENYSSTFESEAKPPKDRAAYIIYTSGSTGRPKGVVVGHRSVINLLQSIQHTPGITKDDRLLAVITLSFDMSVVELYAPIAVGGTTVLATREDTVDPYRLGALIDQHAISIMQATPSTWRLLMESGFQPKQPMMAWTGGEPLARDLAEMLLGNTRQLWNLYGPTENTVYATGTHVLADQHITIGGPVANSSCYVLDENLHQLPVGAPGELFVGGACLAFGYLNQPELTAERFIESPFNADSRLYRTGDLVRWLPDGNIEHLGRIDNQVKIRGFRIELEQIEATLNALPEVSESVVEVVEFTAGDQRLVAYVTPVNGGAIEESELRTYVEQQLPEYMVPQFFTALEFIPRLPNGKVDRKALPSPAEPLTTDNEPLTATEQVIHDQWQAIIAEGRPIGVTQSFFGAGGHSLILTKAVRTLFEHFDVILPFPELYQQPNIRHWAKLIDQARAAEDTGYRAEIIPTAARITDADETVQLPATFSQQSLWFIQQANPNNVAYSLPFGYHVKDTVNLAHLRKAVAAVVANNESLRTSFCGDDSRISQRIHAEPIAEHYTQTAPQAAAEAATTLATWMDQPFDLSRADLFRCLMIPDGWIDAEQEIASGVRVVLRFHHIIIDLLSIHTVIDQIDACYEALQKGLAPKLDKLDVDYGDFAAWQQEHKTAESIAERLETWTSRITDDVSCINLPTDFDRPKRQSFQGDAYRTSVGVALTNQINEFSREHSLSAFNIFFCAYALALQQYSRQNDIIVGVPFANRSDDARLDNMVGMFINTLPVPCEVNNNESFLDHAKKFQEVALAVQANQDIPLNFILDALPVTRDASYNPLYQVSFSLQEAPHKLILGTDNAEPFDVQLDTSMFDLHMALVEEEEGRYDIFLNYDTALYTRTSVDAFLDSYLQILTTALADPAKALNQLVLHSINTEFTQGQITMLPAITNVADYLFMSETHLTHDAVISGEKRLTHAELRTQSAQLASYLQHKGINPGARVGLAINREIEMLPILCGTLRAGVCYVPLDPAYPTDLLNYVIEDAGLDALIMHREVAEQLTLGSDIPILIVEDIWTQLSDYPSTFETEAEPPKDRAAYIIYTSGSTGRPKGVVVGHRSVINLLQSIQHSPGITEDDRLLAVITLSFDMSVVELYAPIAVGGTTVLATREDTVDPYRLGDLIDRHKITIMQATPSTWRLLMEVGFQPQQPLTAWTGGEPLARDLADMLLERTGALWNLYGPTENTVYATGTQVLDSQNITIGKPVANSQCYVLDDNLHQLPIGAPGELFVGGACLAFGYHNQPSLTKERFIDNPFEPGSQLYGTGDLVRWLPQGDIQHLGRIDNQVKIRGYRIELEQIEATLNALPEVSESVVEVVEFTAGDQRLIAYVAPVNGGAITETELRTHVEQQLPEYMVPQIYSVLSTIPRLPNGKVDRKALPSPAEPLTTDNEPLTTTEQVIHDQWQTILGEGRPIGVTQSFFGAGGHSLILTKAVRTLFEHFDIILPFPELYQQPNIRHWAKLIDQARTDEDTGYTAEVIPTAARVIHADETIQLPATYSQQSLWFIQQANPDNVAYSIPLGYNFTEAVNLAHLREAVAAVVENNEALRTSFISDDSRISQRIHAEPIADYYTQTAPYTAEEAEAKLSSWMEQPFDFNYANLFRCLVIPTGWIDAEQEIASGARVVLRFHHIIIDLLSIHTVIDQIDACYEALQKGLAPKLDKLDVDYGDFAAWQQEHKTAESIAERLETWTSRITDDVSCINLPTDFDRPKRQSFLGETYRTNVGSKLTNRVNEFSREHSLSAFNIFFCGYALALQQYSRQSDIIVGVPFANRSDDARLDDMVGMFINTLPVPCKVNNNESFLDHAKKFQEVALAVQANQDIPLNFILDALPVTRDASYNPLYQVSFSLQEAPHKLILGTDNAEPFDVQLDTSMFDLHMALIEEEEGRYGLFLNYDIALYTRDSMDAFIDSYLNILTASLDAPKTALNELTLHNIGATYSQGPALAQPPTSNIADYLFASSLDAEKLAIVSGEQRLTHADLRALAAQFASFLHSQGLTPGTKIGLAINRNIEMVPILTGALWAGVCYVPLDTAYPTDLLNYVIEDAGLDAIVMHRDVAEGLNLIADVPTYIVEDLWSQLPSHPEHFTPEANPPVDRAAYTIYTSGSTGRPKGVVVGHESVINFLQSMQQTPGITRDDRLLAVTTVSFDISVLELYAPIAMGATTVLAGRDDAIDPNRLGKLIDQHAITIMQATPSTWRMLMENDYSPQQPLKAWTGGEPLPRDLAEMLLERTHEVWNLYGPTEATVWVTLSQVLDANDITIGRPIANSQCYVLDDHLHSLPIGAPGELFVGGACLAFGYHDRAELTAERFIDNPFEPGTRLYRTGDLVRWLPDGNIQHLGRIDNQVKIRGFRIELEQIEFTLNHLPQVSESVVTVAEINSGDQRLVAYVAPQSGDTPCEGQLRQLVEKQLPEYMVPQFFVVLESIPRLPNGKVDRNALPSPQAQDAAIDETLSSTEAVIHDQWQEIIGSQAQISVTQSFFGAGGHSLLLTKAARTLFEHFDIGLPFPALFRQPTIRDWAALAEDAISSKNTSYASEVVPFATRQTDSDGRVRLPASFSQQALWFIQRANPDNLAYDIPLAYQFSEAVDVDKLRNAVEVVVAQNETLRSSFEDDEGRVFQVIHAKPTSGFFETSNPQSEADAEHTLDRWMAIQFDLTRNELFRCLVIPIIGDSGDQGATTDVRVVFRFHHIVVDLLSIQNVVSQIESAYQAEETGKALTLGKPKLDYGDFSAWQQEHKTMADVQHRMETWTSRVEETVGCINLPTDFDRPKRQSFTGKTFRVIVETDLTTRLNTFARLHDLSAFNLFFCGYVLTLHRYARQENIIVGVPFANRSDDRRLDELVGLFINTLPVPCHVDTDLNFLEHAKTFQETSMAVQANDDIPLNHLLDMLPVNRDLSYNPLFQVGFSLQAAARGLTLGSAFANAFDVPVDTSMFDLHISLLEEADGTYNVYVNYDSALHTRAKMDAFVDSYLDILNQGLSAPRKALNQIPFQGVQPSFTQGLELAAPSYTNLTDYLFAADCDLNKEAIVTGDECLDHNKLRTQAAQFASFLHSQGLTPGTKIGLAINRNIEMVPILTGALWAGVCYVPLDPTYPTDLLNYVIEDAGLDAIVMHRDVADGLSLIADVPTHIVEDLWPQLPDFPERFTPEANPPVDRAAYTIYTSGSTGRPKGVVVGHESVINFLQSMQKTPGITSDDRLLAVTTVSFDISVLELYAPIAMGATIVLATRDDATDPNRLGKLIDLHSITIMQATPSTWRLLMENDYSPQQPLKAWTGGEPLPRDLAEMLLERTHEVWNLYGPTEATVWVTLSQVLDANAITIGRPIANSQCYVLDDHLHSLPIGAPGELFVGGACLAFGYHDRDELTAERFIDNPFEPGTRLYRTGDLVRWLPDGNIQHLGRIDNQVKIRGFRIELGQIEATINELTEVSETLVDVTTAAPGDQRLVAYVAPHPGQSLTASQLRRHLRSQVPDYMVPQYFVVLPEIPRMPNGKVNRHELPSPDVGLINAGISNPETQTEKQLADIWQVILGVKTVGRGDNFFMVGGHSLLAMRVISQIKTEFGVEFGLPMLVTDSLADIASHIDVRLREAAEQSAIEPKQSIYSKFKNIFTKRS